ncbi:MAG: response regulator [Alphaproteobacteria bacterium]|nr:response regulator [Alphaproteobacteria bacterium]MBF0249025.1 response regulator [Alphaproteobacteria bacterium]
MAKGTVLCIEDGPANMALLKHYFECVDDIEMLAATTAEEGLELARARKPGLILMDIHLPGMSGVEAVAKLREDPETKTIPVIAISADAMPEDIQVAIDQGFNAYLTKPIRFPVLEGLIEELMISTE